MGFAQMAWKLAQSRTAHLFFPGTKFGVPAGRWCLEFDTALYAPEREYYRIIDRAHAGACMTIGGVPTIRL